MEKRWPNTATAMSVRASEEEITKALQGSWRDEHLFSLKVAVELYDFYAEQLVACDQQI